MRICRTLVAKPGIPAGRCIEMQTHAKPGTLIGNAMAAGYAEGEVEELQVSAAEYDAIMDAQKPPPPTADELEADCQGFLNGGSNRIDLRKVVKAKMISDLAFRLGKSPGVLTNAELLAERNRIAAIYKAL